MSDIWQNQRERQEQTRDKLKVQGKDLLRQICVAVSDRLTVGDLAEVNPEQVMSSTGLIGDPILRINGYKVALSIEQHMERGGQGVRCHYSDRLDVSMDWISIGYDIQHKSKTFGYSTRRPGSYGFDVPKIADYILWWINEKKRLEALAREKEAVAEKAEQTQEQWARVLEGAIRNTELPPNVEIEATPAGLRLSVTVNEHQLRRVLKALGVECGPPAAITDLGEGNE